jgi:Cu+-exporting ATPase
MAIDGKPRVASVVALDGRDEASLFALAASVASGLESRLATAFLESANEREIPVKDVDQFQSRTRAGVIAAVDGHTVVLGDSAFLFGLGLSVNSLGDWPERLRQRGERVLFVAVDGRTAGFVGIVDAPE